MITNALCQYKSELAVFMITKESGPLPPLPVVTNADSLKVESLVALINEPYLLDSGSQILG